MKRGKKLPWPTRSVSARVIHVRGPIRTAMDHAAIQQNARFGEDMIKMKADGFFNWPRPDIIGFIKDNAMWCKLYLPKDCIL